MARGESLAGGDSVSVDLGGHVDAVGADDGDHPRIDRHVLPSGRCRLEGPSPGAKVDVVWHQVVNQRREVAEWSSFRFAVAHLDERADGETTVACDLGRTALHASSETTGHTLDAVVVAGNMFLDDHAGPHTRTCFHSTSEFLAARDAGVDTLRARSDPGFDDSGKPDPHRGRLASLSADTPVLYRRQRTMARIDVELAVGSLARGEHVAAIGHTEAAIPRLEGISGDAVSDVDTQTLLGRAYLVAAAAHDAAGAPAEGRHLRMLATDALVDVGSRSPRLGVQVISVELLLDLGRVDEAEPLLASLMRSTYPGSLLQPLRERALTIRRESK